MNLGEVLSTARLAAGISLEDLAAATSIRVGLLTEMERNNFAHCGGDIYARGHLRNLAPILGKDPAELIEHYNREHSIESRGLNELLSENSVTQVPHEKRTMSWKVPAGIALLVLLVYGTVQIVVTNVQSDSTTKPAATAVATATPEASTSEQPLSTESATTVIPATGEVTLLLSAPRGNSRIDIWVDGEQIEKGSIFQGETKSYKGTKSIAVYFSNPAGLDVTVNGKLLEPLGGQNEEVRRTFR